MSSVPQTALPGCSRSASDQMAKGLGYFSLALGLAELLAPRRVADTAGLDGRQNLVRAYGLREIAAGMAILNSHDATPWVWARVLGDAADLATVAATAKQLTKARTILSMVTLAAVTGLDIFCAARLAAEKGGRATARHDYHDRSGFPKGVPAARGIARDFAAPRDMRTPEALQPWGVERQGASLPEEAGGSNAATAATEASSRSG